MREAASRLAPVKRRDGRGFRSRRSSRVNCPRRVLPEKRMGPFLWFLGRLPKGTPFFVARSEPRFLSSCTTKAPWFSLAIEPGTYPGNDVGPGNPRVNGRSSPLARAAWVIASCACGVASTISCSWCWRRSNSSSVIVFFCLITASAESWGEGDDDFRRRCELEIRSILDCCEGPGRKTRLSPRLRCGRIIAGLRSPLSAPLSREGERDLPEFFLWWCLGGVPRCSLSRVTKDGAVRVTGDAEASRISSSSGVCRNFSFSFSGVCCCCVSS